MASGAEVEVVVVQHMPAGDSDLPNDFLDDLSSVLVRLGRPQAGVGFALLAALAQRLPGATSVTVDYTQVQRLRTPLVVVRMQARATATPDWSGLTPRERDVARGLARGLPNKIIARQLGLTVGTVKDYVHRILTKTGHASRSRFAAANTLADQDGES